VLFDLDGTLLDTLEDIGRSANEVLEGLKLPGHPMDAYRRFIGDGVANLFRRAIVEGSARDGDEIDPGLIARCVEGFRESYGRGWNVATRPYPGIPELLDVLSARTLGLAVLSNKPDAFTRQCVDAYLARWPFSVVFGEREGVPRKPDPAGALEVADRLGVPPEAVLYVGDSSVDMETACRAGMLPVGVAWGFRSPEELRAHGALHIIETPLELLGLLAEERGS